MTIKEILDIAAAGYGDDVIRGFYDDAGQFQKVADGDTLARFIVLELIETFDPEATEVEQLKQAVRVMNNATADVRNVRNALNVELIGRIEE